MAIRVEGGPERDVVISTRFHEDRVKARRAIGTSLVDSEEYVCGGTFLNCAGLAPPFAKCEDGTPDPHT